jgi:arginine:ornithine antiporter/lysine permease
MPAPQNSSNAANVKDLSLLALFSLIVGSMMGSGIFDVPQNLAHSSGVIAISIGWVITGVGVLALSWSFAFISKNKPEIKSGLYGYAKHGFGDYIGFNSAWGYALNALLANTSYLIYICATLGNFAVFKFFGAGNTLSALVVESGLIWLVYFLILGGIKEASLVNIILTLIKIMALIAIIIIFILAWNWSKFKSNLQIELHLGNIFAQIKSTMLVTVWDFTGIEAACIFALRARSMQDVIKATMVAAVFVCVVTAIISILPFGILSAAEIRNLSTPSTAGILHYIYGANSGNLVRAAVVISVLGALLAWTMLSSNMFYLAAEDNTMPQIFMRLNHKNVPNIALFISSLLAQIFIITAYFTNAVYLAMIQLATSLILLPYLLAALFALQLIIKERVTDKLALIKGLLAVLYGVWLVYSGGMKFLALSCIMYLLGSGFYFYARFEQKKPWFANKLELGLFLILIIIALLALKQFVPPFFLSGSFA